MCSGNEKIAKAEKDINRFNLYTCWLNDMKLLT